MERDSSLDIAKFIAVILVVWGHLIGGTLSIVKFAITSSHMPVFFVISGYFLSYELKKHSGGTLLKCKIKRLFLPYCIWSLISLCLHSALLLAESKAGFLNGFMQEAVDILLHSRSVWFLIVLFIAELLLILIVTFTRKFRKYAGVLSLSIMMLCFIILFPVLPDQPFSLYKLRWLFPFLILGFVSIEYLNGFKGFRTFLSGKKAMVIVCVIFAGYCILAIRFFEIHSDAYMMSKNGLDPLSMFFYYAGGILGITAILSLAENAGGRLRTFLAEGGTYSMDIYVIHMLGVSPVKKALQSISNPALREVAALIVACLLSITVFLLSRHFLRKFSLYRKSVGLN
ncbi:MAG: acyltransferase family protein [Lachnospiraceae bacterium]|nr:acyltransferase family protein [Lachnospiraceae bacterium]